MARNQDTFKGVFLSNQASVAYYNFRYTNATIVPSSEVLFVTSFNVFFKKHSYFTRAVNNELNKYMSSGILYRWVSQFFDRKYLREAAKPPPRHHLPLSMHQMMGIFTIWWPIMVISSTVFLLELLSFRVAFLRSIFDVI